MACLNCHHFFLNCSQLLGERPQARLQFMIPCLKKRWKRACPACDPADPCLTYMQIFTSNHIKLRFYQAIWMNSPTVCGTLASSTDWHQDVVHPRVLSSGYEGVPCMTIASANAFRKWNLPGKENHMRHLGIEQAWGKFSKELSLPQPFEFGICWNRVVHTVCCGLWEQICLRI